MAIRKNVISICSFILFFHFSFCSIAGNRILCDQRSLSDTVLRFEAQPSAGFNYPYFIRIPKGMAIGKKIYLLVETNNTGVNDTPAVHEHGAYLEAIKYSLGSSVCSNLKIPFLVPVFPRPMKLENTYTHAFDRDAALIRDGEMKRLDLQLIAMIRDAVIQLQKNNIIIYEKVLLNGFSASGTFANRFTLIHPEMVAAVACGGINAMPILPIANIKSQKLIYPLGIYDFQKIFGDTVHMSSYKNVPQYIYMGSKDNNDAVLFDDAYSRKERKIIYQYIGKVMQPDRWENCQRIYKTENLNVTFKTYPDIGHQTDREVFNDVCAFFNKIIDAAD